MEKGYINVLTSFDSFKDSLPAKKVGEAIKNGLKESNFKLNFRFQNTPLSDGGEGFVKCFKNILPEEEVEEKEFVVTGAFPNQKVKAKYLIWQNKVKGKTAVCELANTSGLEMVEMKDRNPYNTTTAGIGQLIKELHINQKINHILLGVGGSSTNDAGLGALKEMGLKIHPKQEQIMIGKDLLNIKRIEKIEGKSLFKDLEIDIACDVANPFFGEQGAPMIYGKQKGMTTEQQKEMDDCFKRLVPIFKEATNKDITSLKGAGAAGGISGGMSAFLNARLKPGIELFAEYVGLEQSIQKADIVFSGEGKYDSQTLNGKVVSHVEYLCSKYNKPLIVVCGKNTVKGKSNVFDLLSLFSFEESMNKTATCIQKLVKAKINPYLGSIINKKK